MNKKNNRDMTLIGDTPGRTILWLGLIIQFIGCSPVTSMKEKAERPNILFIMTDQHFADVMSGVVGDEYIKTPHLDALAESGVRFDRAYAPNPLCIPARNSIFSGYYPFQTGIQHNTGTKLPKQMVCMGKHFKDAGYDTGYFGKWHINIENDDIERHGFDLGRRETCFRGSECTKEHLLPIALP
ncbi:MAG: sulfatase-like hydrolase/transferase [Bacteroidales bacterium]|nr:sulfatase-like hydrolase/transferase [Bacteroidales bacterium]